MASGSNFNPPADLIDRREQTKYRIEKELRELEKRMDKNVLDSAAKQASDKEREKCRGNSLYSGWLKDLPEKMALSAGERERARLVGDERKRLVARGELNIPTRGRVVPGLEEKQKELEWKKSDNQQQKRMLAMDAEAVNQMHTELGPAYKLSPKMLTLDLKKSKSPDNWRRKN